MLILDNVDVYRNQRLSLTMTELKSASSFFLLLQLAVLLLGKLRKLTLCYSLSILVLFENCLIIIFIQHFNSNVDNYF